MTAPLSASAELRQVLGELPGEIEAAKIDEIWLFPARQLGERESGLIVLSLLPSEDEPENHRRVVTIRILVSPGKSGAQIETDVDEQGRAPVDRIEKLIKGVLHRLDVAEDPHHRRIGGDREEWDALIRELGAELDPA